MRLLGVVAISGASVALLAGCSQPLIVDPAPYAADPDCARVMLAMPTSVGGLDVRGTSSQATAAYGAEYPIVVTKDAPNPEVAAAFTAFVLGDQGQAILDRYGFGAP